MSSTEPKKVNYCEDLEQAIFERAFYFCQLQKISLEDYVVILKVAMKNRGYKEDDILY